MLEHVAAKCRSLYRAGEAYQEDDRATWVSQLRAWQSQHGDSKELLKSHTPAEESAPQKPACALEPCTIILVLIMKNRAQ